MRAVAAALGALLALAGAADARMHHPARGHRILAASAPLDTFTAPSGAYSFRKLKSSYSGPAVRIRRASDSLETDINFLGCTGFTGCPWDEAAANAHCASTSCFLVTWYDQSGNVRHLTQATPASQPALVFGCKGSLPCMQSVAAETLVSAASITPVTGLTSLSVVANRALGTSSCVLMRSNSTNRLVAQPAVANSWMVLGGSGGSVVRPANDNQWHASQSVINVAASVLGIDGGETTGSTTGSVTAGTTAILGSVTTTCQWGEGVFWDNYATTAAERTALGANQKNFWGTP